MRNNPKGRRNKAKTAVFRRVKKNPITAKRTVERKPSVQFCLRSLSPKIDCGHVYLYEVSILARYPS